MSEQRRGWHAETWNSGSGQNAAAQTRLQQEFMAGQNPHDRSHSFGWGQRQESLRQKELLKELANRPEYHREYQLQPNEYIGTPRSDRMPEPVYQRPIPNQLQRPFRPAPQQPMDQVGPHIGRLDIIDSKIDNQTRTGQVASDLAFNCGKETQNYLEQVFRSEGPYAVCKLTSDINLQFQKQQVPLKLISRFVAPSDSGLVIDLIDNRTGRPQRTFFLQ